MGERLIKSMTVSYTITDPKDPSVKLHRKVTEVNDLSSLIYQAIRYAKGLEMVINSFQIEVEYE